MELDMHNCTICGGEVKIVPYRQLGIISLVLSIVWLVYVIFRFENWFEFVVETLFLAVPLLATGIFILRRRPKIGYHCPRCKRIYPLEEGSGNPNEDRE